MGRKNQKGFSLLEVMIVLVIMSVMALMGSQAIRTAVQNKKKTDARLKTETVVFDGLRLVATDLEKAFHYQYTLYELERQAQTMAANSQPQTPGSPAPKPPTPPPVRLTQFIGKETSVHFTTLNNQRTTANAQESNQIEVGYYLATCKNRRTDASSQCLWRRSSPIIDIDVTKDGSATPLVENVSLFKLEYMSGDTQKNDWKAAWISDQNGDTDTQNLFPYFVRITLEVHDKESKDVGKFKQMVIANIRFPNNVDPAKRFPPPAQNQQQNPNGQNPNGNNPAINPNFTPPVPPVGGTTGGGTN